MKARRTWSVQCEQATAGAASAVGEHSDVLPRGVTNQNSGPSLAGSWARCQMVCSDVFLPMPVQILKSIGAQECLATRYKYKVQVLQTTDYRLQYGTHLRHQSTVCVILRVLATGTTRSYIPTYKYAVLGVCTSGNIRRTPGTSNDCTRVSRLCILSSRDG